MFSILLLNLNLVMYSFSSDFEAIMPSKFKFQRLYTEYGKKTQHAIIVSSIYFQFYTNNIIYIFILLFHLKYFESIKFSYFNLHILKILNMLLILLILSLRKIT